LSFIATLKSIYQRLPVPSTNFVWRKFPVNPYDLLPPNPVVYDIGSKDARGHYAFGGPPPGTKILCIDIFPGPGVDIVADAHDLSMLADGSADFVAAVGMLLHCKFPEQVMSEFYRVLKPGGVIYLSGPFIFTECDPPTDYAHYSIRGLEHLGRKFDRIDSGFGRGPASAMCHLLVQFAALLLCFNSRVLFGIWTLIFSYLLFWVKYLDLIVGHYNQSNLMYGGAYFIGRKQ
jgi:SAM-dependent methyltransferase